MKKRARAGWLAVLTVVLTAPGAWAEDPPALVFSPLNLTIGATSETGLLRVWNKSDGILEWTIASNQVWLTVDPVSGSNPRYAHNHTEVTVTVDRAGMAQGTYSGELAITSNGGSGICYVTVHVQIEPLLSLSPSMTHVSLNRPEGSFTIHNGGFETLEWSASDDVPWLEVVPSSGDVTSYSSFEPALVLDPAQLPSQTGEHTATVTVTSNGGDASIPVVFVPTWAPGGILGLFADAAGTDCNIVYSGPGLLPVYVVHFHTDGATAIQFSAPKPDCWTDATYLSDTAVYPVTIGNSQVGTALGYGMCLTQPVLVTTINYFVQNQQSEPCCNYPVLPDPNLPSGQIEMVSCDNTIGYALGGFAVVHPDASCMCSRGTVRVEETTWGRVKALYAPE